MEASGTIGAQVRIVPPSMEAYTLAYFTGSKEHNIRMRQRAIERGLRLNEFGLAAEADLGELKGAATAEYSLPALEERDIYHHLDLEYVPPELREDLGEIEGTRRQRTGADVARWDVDTRRIAQSYHPLRWRSVVGGHGGQAQGGWDGHGWASPIILRP